MASTFPTSLDTIPDAAGAPALGGSTPKHSEVHNTLRDAIVAVETRVGITGSTDPASLTYRVSADGEGAAIAALTAKTTPVDADLVGLSDSAAGGVLKKLSWSSIKTALQSVFATLAGVAGGQTLNGGTAAGETLTLRSTAHATKGKILFGTSAYDETNNDLGLGTANPSARLHVVDTIEQQRIGYDAATYLSMTVSNLGAVTYSATGGQYSFKAAASRATMGSELVTNGSFSGSLSGWTDSGSSWSWSAGTALHTAGSASTLSQNISVTSGQTYQVEWTLTRSAGSVSVSVGAVNVVNYASTTVFASAGNTKRTLVAGASGSIALTITPSSDFAGTITGVTVKNVTLGSFPAAVNLLDSAGNTSVSWRVSLSGDLNTAFGFGSHRSRTAGAGNSAYGYGAQYDLTTGVYNNAFGQDSQRSLTIGQSNSAYGASSQRGITSGYYNTAIGMEAQYFLTTGQFNVAVGGFSQRYLADGATQAQVFDRCVHIGTGARVSAENATNEIAIGHYAIGLGSNTAVLGSSSITRTGLRGSVEIIASSSTTESQTQAALAASWTDSTHATRKARVTLSPYDTAAREAGRKPAALPRCSASLGSLRSFGPPH
jgi:hypothetical protein